MLSQLPLEIVDAIADLACMLPQRSVRSLSLVSTTLYAAVFPRLHRAITFRASNEWVLNILEKQIRRLSLITDGTCPHAGQHLEGLSCLAALNELEWEGIQNPSEASALRGCLQHIRRIKGATALISGTSSIHDHSPIPAKCLPNAMRDSNDRGQPMKRERESWAGPRHLGKTKVRGSGNLGADGWEMGKSSDKATLPF
ncbi:hypothetical protein AKAW_11143 [Aspergillus luchuensis IFO 4308]|nr:hypothetical protein AKAW_11143 [Aspergillus luchuensis IFO 4308]